MPPGWPHLWRDVAEGVAWLKVFYDAYQKGQSQNEWTPKVRQHVKETMNCRLQAAKHMEVIAEGVDDWRGPTSHSSIYQAVERISRTLTPSRVVRWEDFVEAVKSDITVAPFRGRVRPDVPGVYDYFRLFLSFGWEDTCEEEYPVFMRGPA